MELRHSEQIGELVTALAKAQGEFKPVKKGTINPFYGTKYADLAEVIEATRPALSKNGLAVIQTPRVVAPKMVEITTMLAHASGQYLAHDMVLPAYQESTDKETGTVRTRFDAQTVGAAITYGRRYSYSAVVGVSAEEDDDANSVTARSNGNGEERMPKPPKKNGNGHSVETTSDSFGRMFWASAKNSGKSEVTVRDFLGSLGYEHTNEVPATKRNECMEWAQSA
jgi:hypothetical protein